TKVKSSSAGVFNANLVAVTGVYENQLQEGETAGLGFDFTIPAAATIGKTWTESVKRETGSKKTSYTIKDITDKTTTVTFISEIEETGANTNLNGLLVLENATGIVLQRIIKSNTSSYETMNDIVYAASRKNILVEVCSKVN